MSFWNVFKEIGPWEIFSVYLGILFLFNRLINVLVPPRKVSKLLDTDQDVERG